MYIVVDKNKHMDAHSKFSDRSIDRKDRQKLGLQEKTKLSNKFPHEI